MPQSDVSFLVRALGWSHPSSVQGSGALGSPATKTTPPHGPIPLTLGDQGPPDSPLASPPRPAGETSPSTQLCVEGEITGVGPGQSGSKASSGHWPALLCFVFYPDLPHPLAKSHSGMGPGPPGHHTRALFIGCPLYYPQTLNPPATGTNMSATGRPANLTSWGQHPNPRCGEMPASEAGIWQQTHALLPPSGLNPAPVSLRHTWALGRCHGVRGRHLPHAWPIGFEPWHPGGPPSSAGC